MEQELEELGVEFVIEPIRYTYYFCNGIDEESVQGLINTLVNYPAVDLYVDTPGGDLNAMKVLLHFLENHPDVKVYLTGMVASAGTFFLTDYSKEVILTEDLKCLLFHLADRGRGSEFRKNSLDWNILQNQLKSWNDKYLEKFAKLGLTKKELKDIAEGRDVVYYQNNFHKLKINAK